MNESKKDEVRVFVRLGSPENHDEREISFRVPERVSLRELLELGYAVDGNTAVMTVWAEGTTPLAEKLHDEQLALLDWLETENGYRVSFA